MVWLMAPSNIIQGVYAKYFGIPLTTIAAVLILARVFDSITDPLVGFYSDRYHRRVGNRKPFIIIGCVLFVISSYFLFVPFGFDTVSITARKT